MKLLIAEDDDHTREALREVLTREGHAVTATANGRDALDSFLSEPPDFVCLDIMMPGLSGYDVCRAIRRKDHRVPVLFLSAKSEEVDRVLGLELGADDFLSKPFGVREFLARIAAIVRRCPWLNAAPDAVGEFPMGDLRIVPAELRAYRQNQPIALSARDLKVLQVFHQRRSQVVDRNTLCDEAWGADHFPNSRALDQHISQLRKKIERDPAAPEIIRTVHAAGYRYE
ncbi:MAG: phoP [Verrucomicrobiaceae bacterium]|nr:phoP [Verrucomicrobiaceae bacterium]